MTKKLGEYCKNPYLKSYGVETMADKMTRRYGQRYRDYRKRWADAESLNPPPFPVNIEFDLIDACTLCCPQCYRNPKLISKMAGRIGNGSRLKYEQIVKVLDEGQRFSLPSVNIGGFGECMLHPDFLKICKAIMDHDVIELRIISNGTLLSKKIAVGLIEQQVHFLSISVDAVSAQTYGKVRGKAEMYQKVVDNINGFLALRKERSLEFPMLRVTFVHQEKNKHEVDKFVDYWSSRADLIDIQTYSDPYKTEYRNDFVCNQPWKRLSIYADGHVVPCCGGPGILFDFGSVNTDSLQSIWMSAQIKRFREALAAKKFPGPCLTCMGTLPSVG